MWMEWVHRVCRRTNVALLLKWRLFELDFNGMRINKIYHFYSMADGIWGLTRVQVIEIKTRCA